MAKRKLFDVEAFKYTSILNYQELISMQQKALKVVCVLPWKKFYIKQKTIMVTNICIGKKLVGKNGEP